MVALKKYEHLEDFIHCVDIGIDNNTDLVRWTRPQTNIFRLEMLHAREMAKPGIYLHIEKSNRRTVFIRKEKIVFIIVADESVQYQLLEAILEVTMKSFFDSYEDLLSGFLTGMTNMFGGFQSLITPLFAKALKENVHWISAHCNVCKANHSVCVKKSFINNAPRYPASIVFKHEGHGLLIYIDGDFKIRGQEVVEITG